MSRRVFVGVGGARLAADDMGEGPPVILLHGGGQTRGSWRRTAQGLVERGYRAIALDARGHGESDWSAEGYSFDLFVGDLRAVIDTLDQPPALVGASLGGLTSMMAMGTAEREIASALVLVDIAARINPAGSAAIHAFMSANPNGFATVEEAADAVSKYMTHRPRPPDVSGLRKNLRERDGRLYWHWDPKFIRPGDNKIDRETFEADLEAAAARITAPTLLVRGEHSEIVTDDAVSRLGELIPGLEVAVTPGAGHMVAGDANTPFASAAFGFLDRVFPAASTASA